MATQPRFDLYQFQSAVSKLKPRDTHLDFHDRDRMHTVRREAGRAGGNVKETPEWALSDAEVRRVICFRISELARTPVPQTLVEIQKCEKKIRRIYTRVKSANAVGVARAKKVGGYAALYAAMLYRTFRLCQDSVTVARSLGMTPVAVRQSLYRLKLAHARMVANPECPGHLWRLRTGRVRRSPTRRDPVPFSRHPAKYKKKFDFALVLESTENGVKTHFAARRLGAVAPSDALEVPACR